MKPRRKLTTFRQPAHFPADSVARGWGARHLAGHAEFDAYHFVDCDFTGADLGGLRFADCLFERCNLVGVRLAGTALQNVAFTGCKLLGL